MKIPTITEVHFTVSKKVKGKRYIWCHGKAELQMLSGFSQTSFELAYKDFRKQFKALSK